MCHVASDGKAANVDFFRIGMNVGLQRIDELTKESNIIRRRPVEREIVVKNRPQCMALTTLQRVRISHGKANLIRLAAQLADRFHLRSTLLRSVQSDHQRTGVGRIPRRNVQNIGADYAVYAYRAISPGLEIAAARRGPGRAATPARKQQQPK